MPRDITEWPYLLQRFQEAQVDDEEFEVLLEENSVYLVSLQLSALEGDERLELNLLNLIRSTSLETRGAN